MAKEKQWAGKFRPNRDMDHNGNTNDARADRAELAVNAYGEGNYGDILDPCVIQDLLCDLMHYCDRRAGELDDETFGAMLESARSCYEEER